MGTVHPLEGTTTVKKTVSTLRVVGDDDATTALPALPAELQVAFGDIAAGARDGLLAMSVAVGLAVMNEMMETEVTDRVGPKHPSSRTAPRPGRARRWARSCWAAGGCR